MSFKRCLRVYVTANTKTYQKNLFQVPAHTCTVPRSLAYTLTRSTHAQYVVSARAYVVSVAVTHVVLLVRIRTLAVGGGGDAAAVPHQKQLDLNEL